MPRNAINPSDDQRRQALGDASIDGSSAARDIEAPRDAQGLRRILEERINEDRLKDEPKKSPSPAKNPDANRKRMLRRALKAAAGIAIVAVFGWLPFQALLQTSSVEAVVNSRVVTLRAPIDGKVNAGSDAAPSLDGIIKEGATILRVTNPRAERNRLDELRRQLSRLENERPALVAKLAAAETAQKDLGRQAAQFLEGRVAQLEARIAEIQSSVEAAAARREEANAAFERASSLVKSGTVSSVELNRVTRELTVAQQTETGARRRLDATEVELKAARSGSFLGDSYNDRPSSVQRQEEMRQRAETLKADLAATDAEFAWLSGELVFEQVRYSNLAEALIKLPITGRVWEMMTAPGEDVRAGQPLVRVLDCSGALVTANVTESVYNGLQVGEAAKFRPADGGPDLEGTIVNLTGAAGAAANLAINPDALSKEPYRVTVSVPALKGTAQDCKVGRTGRVIFAGDNARNP